jgi:diacylglycerol kinase family enzyme
MTGLLLANTRYLGPFRVTPEASAADGRLDAWFLAAGAMKQTLHNLAVVTRTRFYLPAKPVPARRVSIRFARPRDVLVDGERYADIVRVEAALLRGGLRLYQPPAPGEEILP